MPRKPCPQPPGDSLHIVRRGHNRSPCFFGEADHALYVSLLQRFAEESGTAVHAYVLMPNHVHLLVTPGEANGASRLMYLLGLHYSKAVNRKLRRTGTLWEERLHASAVRSDAYVLTCHRYIELNPVRAGIVAHPADYRWSSYASNTRIEPAGWLQPHATVSALGSTADSAASNYRALFGQALDDVIIANLRTIGEPPGTTNVPRSGGQADANWSSARRA